MQRFRVFFLPLAEADLLSLHLEIAGESGLSVSDRYIERIEAVCRSLETFPERGTRRHNLGPGLRTLEFERRATIVFRVANAEVEIVRIFYGGRDYERWFRRQEERS